VALRTTNPTRMTLLARHERLWETLNSIGQVMSLRHLICPGRKIASPIFVLTSETANQVLQRGHFSGVTYPTLVVYPGSFQYGYICMDSHMYDTWCSTTKAHPHHTYIPGELRRKLSCWEIALHPPHTEDLTPKLSLEGLCRREIGVASRYCAK
jgi:hypothetical protein